VHCRVLLRVQTLRRMPGGCSSVPSACRGWSRAFCDAGSGAGALRMKAPHRSPPPAAWRSGAIASQAYVH